MQTKGAFVFALGILASPVHAQPEGVEIYGLIDLGITTLNHSQPFDQSLGTVPMTNKYATSRYTGVVSGSLQTSRVGFRGQEYLGDGSTVVFALESHINANSGTLGAGASVTGDKAGSNQVADSSCTGQLFCRQAWIGLKGDYGTIGLGRQYAFTYEIISAYDPFFASNSLDGAGSTQQGGGNTMDVRINNSVKYTTKLGNANFGLEYGAGGIAGRPSAGMFLGLGAGYEAGPFGIQGAWQKKNDSQIWSASTAAVNTVYDTDTEALLLAAKYRWENFLLHGGYQRIDLKTGSNNLCIAGASYACGARNRYDGKKTGLWYGGVTYAATPKLNLVGATYTLHQPAYQNGTASQIDGHQIDFSFMADYRLSKRTSFYAATRNTNLSGGNASGYANTSFTLLTTGVRHVF